MKFSNARKILAVLLSAALLIACIPMAVFADEFVEENLLQTKLDTENSHGILFDHRGKTVSSSTGGGIATNGVVAGLVDGDTSTAHDIWGMSSNYAWGEGYNWYGVQYKLTEVSFASRLDVYADYDGMEHYYDVYASESEADLYCGLNYMGKIYCNGTVQSVKINKDVQFVAIVLDAITSGDTNARPKEIQLWSGDEENAFVPVDLTDASLGKYTSYTSVSINSSTLVTSAWNTGNSSNNSEMTKLAYIASNVTGSHEDFNPNSNYGGFMFTFDDMYYIGDVVIDSDIWTYDQDWAIYASTSSSNLLTNDSLVADNIHCKYGAGNRVTINAYAQYVAIVFKGYTRVRAIRIYTADSTGVPAPFISENVLLTDSGMTSSPFWQVKSTGAITDGNYYAVNDDRFAAYTDGNTSQHYDMRGFNTSTYRVGGRYELSQPYYIGNIVLYASIGVDYPEVYSVYAASSLVDLFLEENCVLQSETTTGAGLVIPVNAEVQYIAFVCEDYTGNPRFKEIEAWTAEEPETPEDPGEPVFTPANVLRTGVDSSTGFLMDTSTGAVSVNTERFTDEKIGTVTDGVNSVTTDVYGALDWVPTSYYVGAKFALETETIISTAKVYAGDAEHNETWRVYASDSEADLFAPQNLAGEKVCAGAQVKFTINKSVSYIAFVCTNYDGNMRVAEFEAWSAEEIEGFVSENALETHIASSRAIKLFPDTGTVEDSPIFDTHGALGYSVDGDTGTHHDVTAPYADPTQYFGGEYTLDDFYYIGNAIIYTGFEAYPDTVRVYASSEIENLYTAENLITNGLVCTGTAQTVAIDKYVKYFAVVYESYGRAKEFQLWTADAQGLEPPEEPFVSENVLETKIASSRTMKMFDSGNVADSSVFGAEALAGVVDGVTNVHYDISSPYTDPNQYFGAEFTLDDEYFIGNAVIYSGFDNLPDTVCVYASDSIDSLYNPANMVAENLVCGTAAESITINKNVQYFAVVYRTYGRTKEFQLWTADPNAAGPVSPSTLSVLTIGNSYSENTSIYASEIALANGKNLTFGYLKSPSCSIEKHYNAAVNDIAGFKFQITSPDGNGGVTRTTIKDGSGTTVDNPDAEHGATIDEALAYKNWDVIVLQQESSSSRSYETFAYLDELVEYVHTACPDAKLMFHEVWRWGEWEASEFFGAGKIKENAERVARENGLEIIPSGLAFEYARELMDSATYPNEDDGHWQHANTVGQYLAGVAYVDALFGIQCSESAFASHPYINADSNVAGLTECANKAARYYKSYGDLDFDGEINAEDLTTLIDVLLEKDGTEYDATLADVNNDGNINVVDIVSLKKKLVTLNEAE